MIEFLLRRLAGSRLNHLEATEESANSKLSIPTNPRSRQKQAGKTFRKVTSPLSPCQADVWEFPCKILIQFSFWVLAPRGACARKKVNPMPGISKRDWRHRRICM